MESARQPLLGVTEDTVRKRKNATEKKTHWSEKIPEYVRVYLARRKKPDPVYIKATEAVVVIGTILFAIYCYLYFENVHFHAVHAYAHLGYSEAQHQVGQRYLNGVGVNAHPEKAMEWFKKASDQGHPHASFNLAIGHLKGIKTPLRAGEAHSLIADAAQKGMSEAHDTLHHVCSRGGCDT